MISSFRTRLILALAAMAAVSACDGPTNADRSRPADLAIVSSTTISDTIQGTHTLRFQVVGQDGRGYDRADVQVSVLGITLVSIDGATGGVAGSSWTGRTDADGNAAVVLRMGTTPGTARVEVRATGVEKTDTADVVVRAGAPVRLRRSVVDTVVYRGDSYPLDLYADRLDNVTAPLDVQVDLPGGADYRDGRITGNAFGIATFVVARPASQQQLRRADTLNVAVTPRATLAVRVVYRSADSAGLATVELNGSNRRWLGRYLFGPAWSPDGASIAAHAVFGGPQYGYIDRFLYLINPSTGAPRRLTSDPVPYTSSIPEEIDATFARDGRWVYFVERPRSTSAIRMWRVHPDGSGLERLTPRPSFSSESSPSPSPDGSRLAYVADGTLRVLDLASGSSTHVAANVVKVRWATQGEMLAYISSPTTFAAGMGIVNSDGTGARTLAPHLVFRSVNWSPDGRWIVASGRVPGEDEYMFLIDVATLKIIRLPSSRDVTDPDWKP